MEILTPRKNVSHTWTKIIDYTSLQFACCLLFLIKFFILLIFLFIETFERVVAHGNI